MHDTTTATETPAHSAAVLAHGLHAVAAHVIAHRLDYRSIEARPDEDGITVRLLLDDVDRWLDSGVTLTGTTSRPVASSNRHAIVHTTTATLPDTGVRIRLVSAQLHRPGLAVAR